MKIKFDVTPTEFIIIKDILKKYLTKDCKAYVFGSRAKSSSLHGSDLDLALECKEKIDFKKLSKIKIDFEDSRLPYMVDVIDLQATKEYFKNMIEKEMIEFPLGKLERVPELRFKEFSGEWEEKKLGDIATFFSGGTPTSTNRTYYSGTISFIGSGNINDNQVNQYITEEALNNSSAKLINKGDILYALYGATSGEVAISKLNGAINQAILCIRTNEDKYFIYQWLNLKKYKILSTYLQGGQGNLSSKIIKDLKLNLPKKQEQKKIASFLTTVDKKIEQLTKKVKFQEQYKKGVMQKIFKQEIRFKNDDGSEFEEWEWKNGNLIFKSISNKNHNSDLPILAISQEYGAIPRDMIDYKISVTNNSISSYKVVEIGDFIISLRSFQGGIEYSKYKGICSPAYIILKSIIEINNIFFKSYFKTPTYIQQLNSKIEGIRDGKMISYKYFSEIKLPLPQKQEQTKIANFLSSLDKKIDSTKEQLAKTKEFKKGLLQRIFV